MSYDVFILSSMAVGILGLIFYSYKMARSQVYPVGIVRKGRDHVTKQGWDDVLASTVPQHLIKGMQKRELSPYERQILYVHFQQRLKPRAVGVEKNESFRQYVFHRHALSKNPEWHCPECGLVQTFDKEFRCRRCPYRQDSETPKQGGGVEHSNAAENRPLALQNQIVEHDKALQDLEKRIRQLERESVVQRIAETRPELTEQRLGPEVQN